MHPDDGRVVSNFALRALRGDAISIFDDGTHTRSFCNVDDLVEGLLRLMATGSDVTGPINPGNPAEMTIAALAEMIIALTDSRSKIIYLPLPQDDPRQRNPDIGRVPGFGLGAIATIAYFDQMLSRAIEFAKLT